MGLFDFLKKKNKGIDDATFHSLQFQREICALALWKLNVHNGNPTIASNELKKAGLNDEQVAFVLKKVKQIQSNDKNPDPVNPGTEEQVFQSEQFIQTLTDKAYDLYFRNNQDYDLVKEALLKKGLNNQQADLILEKLKSKVANSVEDFKDQMESGAISGITFKPNPEHVKGKTDREQVDRYIAYGAFQLEQNNLDNALELFDKAIELDENATLAYANKGSLYSKKGDNEKALHFYNKALSIEPNHVEILENKLDLLLETLDQENEKEFIATAKQILKNNPNHPNALIYVIQSNLKEGDTENALMSVKKLFANYHSESIAIQLLLDVFHQLPKEKALTEFTQFKTEINEHAQYQLEYCKGLYLMGMKEYEQSIATFEALNKLQEFSWNYYQMAIIKNFQNDSEACFRLLKKTFELESGLKQDARQIPYFQNLGSHPVFMELIR